MIKSNTTALFHGSSNELSGDFLNPSQGKDVAERPENNYFAVYATDRKDLAIAMAIIGCSDTIGGSIDEYVDGKLNAKIYGDFPSQEYIFLHYLPIKSFKQTKIDEHQFYSLKVVKPLKTEKIRVKDYYHLFVVASEQETNNWIKKYSDINN